MDKLELISLKNIELDDEFWNRYLRLVGQVIIPYQWDILNDNLKDVETSHSIANFEIAAGRKEGKFYGAVFQDTDVAKWLEAVGFYLAVKKDEEWEKKADWLIDLIAEAQQPDGYINTYYTIMAPNERFTNLKEGHELYTAGHLMEAAVAYYKATGKDKFLNCMSRFADLICDVFSEEKNKEAYPGHQEVEIGLVKLYEVTGEEKYAKQAKLFLERRGQQPYYFSEEKKNPIYHGIFPELQKYDPKYSQSHTKIYSQKTIEGHAVRAVYMCSAMADVAAIYNDEEMLEACKNLWDNMANRRMYITGSIGSSGILERFTTDYDLPNNSNYSETCASIGLAMFARRMAQIERDGKYVDIYERALYNTLLSGIAMDGKSFFYVNPLEVWPANCLPFTSKEHVAAIRKKWFGVACCPPNIARTLASLGEYVAFIDQESLWLNLFINGKMKVILNGKEVSVTVHTQYPYNGRIMIICDSSEKIKGKIHIRKPEFTDKISICVNRKKLDNIDEEKGYIALELTSEHTEIVYDMELEPRIMRANPRVREDIGKVAIQKGPLVYCLEEVDNGTNLSALSIDTKKRFTEKYDEKLLGGCNVIHALGKRIIEQKWDENILYQSQEVHKENETLKFVPYPYWGNREKGEMLVWIKEM